MRRNTFLSSVLIIALGSIVSEAQVFNPTVETDPIAMAQFPGTTNSLRNAAALTNTAAVSMTAFGAATSSISFSTSNAYTVGTIAKPATDVLYGASRSLTSTVNTIESNTSNWNSAFSWGNWATGVVSATLTNANLWVTNLYATNVTFGAAANFSNNNLTNTAHLIPNTSNTYTLGNLARPYADLIYDGSQSLTSKVVQLNASDTFNSNAVVAITNNYLQVTNYPVNGSLLIASVLGSATNLYWSKPSYQISASYLICTNDTNGYAWLPYTSVTTTVTNLTLELAAGGPMWGDVIAATNGKSPTAYDYVAYTGVVLVAGTSSNRNYSFVINPNCRWTWIPTNAAASGSNGIVNFWVTE